jgi:hypothetical protein
LDLTPRTSRDFRTFTVKLPIVPIKMSDTAGSLAYNVSVGPLLASQWSAYWAIVCDQWRLIASDFSLEAVNSQTGIGLAWYSEFNSSPPTFATSDSRMSTPIRNNQGAPNGSRIRMRWRPNDLTQLGFTSTGGSYVPVYFKVYSDGTNLALTSMTAGVYMLTGTVTLQLQVIG